MATLAHVPSLQGDGNVQQIVQMVPGEGEDSYVKNSSTQAHVLQLVELPLWQGIRSASRIPEMANAGKALRVADLGCATGDNTVQAMDKLLESLAALWESKSHGQPQTFPQDVEVSLNDLASNDFNNLFRRLSPGGSGSRRYFAAGVPGSFFGPLFPAVPVHVQGANPAVDRAFANQSSRDLTAFLTNRSIELVPGGFLALAMFAKADEQPTITPPGLRSPFSSASWPH